jgi:hypothetical protein
MSVPKPARATTRRTLAATLIVPLLAAYLMSFAALRNFGRIGVWTLPGTQKEYETTIKKPRVPPGRTTIQMGSGEVHSDPVNVANDGDVLPQEYRRVLNGVFWPVRWVEKTVWESSIDFCEHHTEPKDAFGVRLHFNLDYKF